MKYRTKLYIALVGISLISTLFALVIFYNQAKSQLLRELRSKATSIAAATAALVDGESLSKIQGPADEASDAFKTLNHQLLKVRADNRRLDLYVTYVYIMRPDSKDPNQLAFIIDAFTDPNDRAVPGEIYYEAPHLGINANQGYYYSPHHFITDHWGTSLSGFAPIFDKEGKYLATVGVDLRASVIFKKLANLVQFGSFALAGSIFAALLGAFFLSRRVTTSLATICTCVAEVGKGNLQSHVELHTRDEFNDLGVTINEMIKGLQERERLKVNFARYVSQHVLEKIIQSDTPMKLEGERRKITVLFSDIRQFTHLSEHLPPEQVVGLLNEYFANMIDVIFKHGGTLDKFIGDGIMVEFGAPLEDPLQEKHAIDTAIEMQHVLQQLCDGWKREGKPQIDIGIGIHTGHAVVGNIGSEKRMEYTAIGDTVNVAARLEQATKIVKMPILVSETTFLAAKDHFKYQNLGPMLLPGRTVEIVVYAIQPLENT
jgi:adenylate cyclase